jgi:hypothetical protein
MLAFYGAPIHYPAYSRGNKVLQTLNQYHPPDVATWLPQRHSAHELIRALPHVPTRLVWPKGGTERSRFTRPPGEEEVRAFEAAAPRAVETPMTIRTVYLHNDATRCSQSERLVTRPSAEDGFWQTFCCVKRTVVGLDLEWVARCVALTPPTAAETRDLETALDCLSLARDGDAGHHVVQFEAA